MYISVGIFHCFALGEFRISMSQSFVRAKSVFLPITLFSIKLSLLWMVPFVFMMVVAIVLYGDSEAIKALITIIMISSMLVSMIIGAAIALLRKDYRLRPTLKFLSNNLFQLLSRRLSDLG